MRNIEEKLKNSRVFLYGAGNIGMNLFKFLKNQIDVCGFLDIKSTKDSIEGVKVFNPFIAEIDKENAFVIVSIFNREFNFELIKEQLRLLTDIVIRALEKLGMKARILNSLEILDLFYSFYNPNQIKTQALSGQTLQKLLENNYV